MTTERWLSPLFLGDVEPSLRERFESPQLETLLAAAVEAGRLAFAHVTLDDAIFVEHIASVVDDDTDLGALHAGDLYLACACAHGDAAAVAIFERDFVSKLAPALRSTGLDGSATEEVTQRVREAVLVGTNGVPGIAGYSGRGPLRSWLRAVAVRHAMMEFRGRKETPVGDDAMLEMPAVANDPQLAPWKEQYAAAFRSAFEHAINALDENQRTLLRQHHIDRLSIDALAALHKVHRATAARWIAAAREALLTAMRERVVQLLPISGSELESAFRLARSQLDLSIHRLLVAKPGRKK